jgi:ornithine cyclodeaminase/alanine dehydrogenase-like protein (mu-crystallin family)
MTVSSILDWEELKRPTPPMTPRPSTPAAASSAAAASSSNSKLPPKDASTSSSGGIRILSSTDVSSVLDQLSLDDFLKSQQGAFQAFSASRVQAGKEASSSPSSSSTAAVQTPLRISLALANHTTLFMPAAMAGLPPTCKIVSVPAPSAPAEIAARGLPGTTVVLDADSGEVAGLVNAGELTGVRTAAGSAVASRAILGKGEGRSKIVVFGSGVQAFWQCVLASLGPRPRQQPG